MRFPPLTDGKIIARRQRFLADIELASGEAVVAHCPNTGAMTGCWAPDAAVQLSASDNPKRKLGWTLERVNMGAGWVGVNTHRVNHIIAEFIANQQIEPLRGYASMQKEPRCHAPGLPPSRLDLLLKGPHRRDCCVEIKNATWLVGNRIQFPDAVTTRGKKHLELLQHFAQNGQRAALLFAVNRPEGDCFRVAAEIDPRYAETLRRARQNGVEIMARRIRHTASGVEAGAEVPIEWA